jgi:hypothetical protein
MGIGIAADHGGFELKVQLTSALKSAGYEVMDFGAHKLVTEDDYPDFVVPLAKGSSGRRYHQRCGYLRQRCRGLYCCEQGARCSGGVNH